MIDWRKNKLEVHGDIALLDKFRKRVKCDDQEFSLYGFRGYLEYKCFTAETPPIAWLKKVSKDYPKLEFDLHCGDDGFGYMGCIVVKNGKVNDKRWSEKFSNG